MNAPLARPVAATGARPGLGTVLLLGALTAFGAVSIDLYLPALPLIGSTLGTGAGDAAGTMSAFFLGMAVGQLFYGPLSDRWGRRPPVLLGCAIYVLASLACAAAPSLAALTGARFLQALGACAGVVVARAIVRDRYDAQESARVFSLLTLVLGVAPMVAPTIGAAILSVGGWRLIFLLLALFGTALGLAVWLRLDESRSAETARLAAGESPLASYVAALRQRRLLGYVLAGAFNGACLFAYVASAADLFIDVYGMGAAGFGWIFAVNAIGLIAASQVNRWLLLRAPGHRIIAVASVATIASGAALLAAALTDWGGMWGVMIGLFAILTSYGFISANATAGALAVDPARAGAVSALVGAASFAAGAAAAAFVGWLHDGTAVPMAATMFGGTCLAAAALFGLALRR